LNNAVIASESVFDESKSLPKGFSTITLHSALLKYGLITYRLRGKNSCENRYNNDCCSDGGFHIYDEELNMLFHVLMFQPVGSFDNNHIDKMSKYISVFYST
jgi:hypothetical protein